MKRHLFQLKSRRHFFCFWYPIIYREMDWDSTASNEDEFLPLEVMPTSRLNDIAVLLDKKVSSVVSFDAVLPPKEAGEHVLKSLLFKVSSNVKVMSLRYNQLSLYSIDLIISWVAGNAFLETLYVMGSGFDEKNRLRLEDAWKKHLIGHRTTNMGYTFLRVTADKKVAVAD
jgi:hypothetical protein